MDHVGVAAAGNNWFCYMVRCKDEALYVGIAQNVDERLKRHSCGVVPDFTAKRRPVELIWSEHCGDARAARLREKEIKGWSREKKLAFVLKSAAKSSRPV